MDPLFVPSWVFDAAPAWIGAFALASTSALAGVTWHYRRLFLEAAEDRRNSQELIENLSEGIYRSLPDGRQLSANRALVRLNGYRDEAELLRGVKNIGTEWYVDPKRRDEFRRILMEKGRVDDFVSEIYRHKTRNRIWITESARLVRHRRSGKPLFYEGSVREITETVERLRLEERFQKLTRQLPGVLFQIEVPDVGLPRIAYLSPGVTAITGHERSAHLADPSLFNRLIVETDMAAFNQSLAEAQENLAPWEVEFRIRARDGKEKWLRVTAAPEASPGLFTWHGYVADISARRKQQSEMEELAYFDPLTKLPNRRMFMQRIARVTARQAAIGALLFIDLDNFKTLNDTQGHDVGDAYLVQVAARLKACVGPDDLVARLGGDEFVVLLGAGLADTAHALRLAITTAHRIVATMRESFAIGPTRHLGSASVGVVAFDGTERRAEEILKRADVAMYQAKAAGRNGVALFDPATLDEEASRYRLLQELRVAIAENQLVLHFQPQFDDERNLRGAEALVRWQHPTRGLIMPEQFVPLAEQFGLNAELGRHILDMGLAALAFWQRSPVTSKLRLAFNVGVQLFAGDTFIPIVKEMIDRHELDATMLTFELTENILAKDHLQVAARMHDVKKLGARLSLDDFGTGSSSLATLRQLPFDEIKIDGKFVADIEVSDEGRSLVRTILTMARMLRLKAVAEHIENIRQESFLRAFGCDLFQGHLYAPAMTEPELRRFVRDHRAGTDMKVAADPRQVG